MINRNAIKKIISDAIHDKVWPESAEYGWAGQKYIINNVDNASEYILKQLEDNDVIIFTAALDDAALDDDDDALPPILPALMGTRCDEPCEFDPLCRMWFEVKDECTTEDRAKAMTYLIEDLNCPLFKQQVKQQVKQQAKRQTIEKRQKGILVVLSELSSYAKHYPKGTIFELCDDDNDKGMVNIKYMCNGVYKSIYVPRVDIIQIYRKKEDDEELGIWIGRG